MKEITEEQIKIFIKNRDILIEELNILAKKFSDLHQHDVSPMLYYIVSAMHSNDTKELYEVMNEWAKRQELKLDALSIINKGE